MQEHNETDDFRASPGDANAAIAQALSDEFSALDTEHITAQVEAVLGDDLYWFPVRHHSPAVAKRVAEAIETRQPKVVFIEGPAEAQELIPFITVPDTQPPIAIFSSYRDDDNVLGWAGIHSPGPDIPARFGCWYPLVSYSPEYVAMQTAKRLGSEVVFIDLPHHALIRSAKALANDPQGAEALDPAKSSTDDLMATSSFFQRLAHEAGYRSWDEAWDAIFEISTHDLESFRYELATFCAASRATANRDRILRDGTLERERHFRSTIERTLKERGIDRKDAMVVCGGFHLFMDHKDDSAPPAPPPGTVYVTLMPYSFFRISELSGYGAGNRAPNFYHTWWELERTGRLDTLVSEHTINILKKIRRHSSGASSADAIAVRQHAHMLASLRGRRFPILCDIDDAIITCCCKGNPQEEGQALRAAIDGVNIGTKVGKVTGSLGRLPIVSDFYAQISDLEFGEVFQHERRIPMSLDKRNVLDNRRSIFLHRAKFLQVPFASLKSTDGSEFGSSKLFREEWELKWNPKIEPFLIEQTLLGESIEAAAVSRLQELLALDGHHAGRTCRMLREAMQMDLPNMIAHVQEACSSAIDTDNRFLSLTEAVVHLCVLEQLAAYKQLAVAPIIELITRCFDRACFALSDVISAPDEQHNAIVMGLSNLAELILRNSAVVLDRDVFVNQVRSVADLTEVPYLRGAFLGMLAELRELPMDFLAKEISAFAVTSKERMVLAGDFVDGVLAVSRTSIMLGADAIVKAMDELLRAAEWEVFLTMLPRMRAAFERMHARQVDSLAAVVARMYGLSEDQRESLLELNTSVGAAAVIADIDRRVSELMQNWSF